MADLLIDMGYALMTINSQIIYRPINERDDPEPDNDHEVYVGNLPPNYSIEKFVNFAKISGKIYSVRLLKGSGGLNKGFGYIMYRHLISVKIAIRKYNGILLMESYKPLIVQKSLRNTIMMIYGLTPKSNNKCFIKTEINYFVKYHPTLLLKFEYEDDNKLFISFKSLKAAQIFKKKLKELFNNLYAAKMYYFNDTKNWERWEDLKKNNLVNPQGNRVRFIPILPKNCNRPNTLPPTSSLLFKPFIPKRIASFPGKENINLTQHINNKETKNIPVTYNEPTLYQPRYNMPNNKPIGPQFSKNQQEVNNFNISSSYNMNALKKSLPKWPLRDIQKNDNSTKYFGCTLPQKIHAFKKPFAPERNYLSQTLQNTNYALNSPSYPLPISPPSQKLYSITDNSNTSFFTSDADLLSSATNQNINTFKQNSYNYISQPFNMDDVWRNY